MSRYIDADGLIDAIEYCSYTTWSQDINRAWWAQAVKVKDNLINCIKNTPTADVVEVRHGKWVEDEITYCGAGRCNYKCTVCGKIITATRRDTTEHLHQYCPFCGAKMDGERNEKWNLT